MKHLRFKEMFSLLLFFNTSTNNVNVEIRKKRVDKRPKKNFFHFIFSAALDTVPYS